MAREFVTRKCAHRMEKSARRLPQVWAEKIKTGRTKIVLPDFCCLDYNCTYVVPFKTPPSQFTNVVPAQRVPLANRQTSPFKNFPYHREFPLANRKEFSIQRIPAP